MVEKFFFSADSDVRIICITLIIITFIICAAIVWISLAKIKERNKRYNSNLQDAAKYQGFCMCENCELRKNR